MRCGIDVSCAFSSTGPSSPRDIAATGLPHSVRDFRKTSFEELLFRIRVHPPIHSLVPVFAVLRFQYPVSFVREVQHFGRYLLALQGGKELESLRDVKPVVKLAVD